MNSENQHETRDAETNVALGAFVTILGTSVCAGTLIAPTPRAMTVNAVAGGVLVLIGVGFLVIGLKALKKSK